MIPDTDEQLLIEAEKYGLLPMSLGKLSFKIFQLRDLINHYIAKDRAQGQEPAAFVYIQNDGLHKVVAQRQLEQHQKLYTHAQPIAEIQADALEKTTDSDWHERRDLSYKEYLIKLAAKLRRGEFGQ